MIDEGITETFHLKTDSILTDLPENYSKFKPASKLCCLKKIHKDEDVNCIDDEIDYSWSMETTNYFKKLTSNNTRTFYLNAVNLEKEKIKNANNELEDIYNVDIFYL